MTTAYVNLMDAVHLHRSLLERRDAAYINLIQQINSRSASIIKDDMGSQFVVNCGRDIAGEVVRNLFDTSAYNITVDQLANRILKFSYEEEYDPLSEHGGIEEIRKNVLNHNEFKSSELDKITEEIDRGQQKLFNKKEGSIYYEDQTLIDKGKREYRSKQSQKFDDGTPRDEQTGKVEEYRERSDGVQTSRLDVDHNLDLDGATYHDRYTTEEGKERLRAFYNSDANFSMMYDSANRSKGAIKIYEKNGRILSPNDIRVEKERISKEIEKKTGRKPSPGEVNLAFESQTVDASHKATARQFADAVCDKWENADEKVKQELINQGYLNEEGKVPKALRAQEEAKFRCSMNALSWETLKDTDYGNVASDAAAALFGIKRETTSAEGNNSSSKTENNKNQEESNEKKGSKGSIGKIIAGQIIYYSAPPLVYELRLILMNRRIKLDTALGELAKAAKRIGKYVLSKIKDIFLNVAVNSLKQFIKTFMDILINIVKETVKKILKVAKSLVMSTVDAIRIIADKNTSRAEKADAIFSLFSVTITSCVIELLFELIESSGVLPKPICEILLMPLQILATVVCTNFTMLILQKADLFDVRFGFKINAIKDIFAEEYGNYEREMAIASNMTEKEVAKLLEQAKSDCLIIYRELEELDPMRASVRDHLERAGQMFNVYIDYDAKWNEFLGVESSYQPNYEEQSDSLTGFRVDYSNNRKVGLAAVILYIYMTKEKLHLEEENLIGPFKLPKNASDEIKKIVNLSPLIFGDVKTRLDDVADEDILEFKTMVDDLMLTYPEHTAQKYRFNQYCISRDLDI